MPASTNTRTSHSHPLQINALSARSGLLGLTFCPGKKQALPASGTAWDRQLDVDIAALQQWQTALLLSLVEPDELDVLKVPDLGPAVQAAGIDWLLLPIVDQQVPDAAFEAAWQRESSRLHALLDAGQRIVIHCKGGLGRTGTIAARLLIESGVETEAAIRQVRMARPGAIENDMQEAYVRGLARRGVAR
jgi:rhodanese-related sulfurtransferase